MRRRCIEIDPRARELIGAWLVCLAVATVCFSLLAAVAPRGRDLQRALIGLDPPVTVAVDADRADAHRPWRC